MDGHWEPVEDFPSPTRFILPDDMLNRTTKGALAVLEEVYRVLIQKEKGYGDIKEEIRVFSKPKTPLEKVCDRIDHKLTRIRNLGFDTKDEDTLEDLIGYLALLASLRDQENK